MFGKKEKPNEAGRDMAPSNGGALVETKDVQMELTQPTSQGGVSAEDVVISRAKILKEPEEGMVSGTIVDNATNEILPGTIIPLFVFKNYAEFDEDLNLIRTTMNRNEKWVEEGLQWVDDEKPTIVQFMNFMCVFGDNYAFPVILSFKRTSLKKGKRLLTLLMKNCGIGKPEGHTSEQFVKKFRYAISTELVKDKKFAYYQSVVKTIREDSERMLAPELQAKLASIADSYRNMLSRAKPEDLVGARDREEPIPGVLGD